MVTNVLSAKIHDGKLVDTVAWALKLAAYVNEHVPGANLQVVRNVGGAMYELHWVGTAESLAAYDELNKRINADEGYQKLLNEGREQRLVIGSSVTERLYETVA